MVRLDRIVTNWSRQNQVIDARYEDFFAGFGFGCATGAFTTFEENSPVCGGFGFPRILITSLRSSFYALVSVAGSLHRHSYASRSSLEEQEASALPTLSLTPALASRMSFSLRNAMIRP